MKLKTVLIVILMIIFALIIFNTTRNAIIINKMIDKQAQLKDCKNYSFTRMEYSTKEDGKKVEFKVYFKDGIGVMELPENNYVWCNTETKELIYYNTDERKASTLTGELGGIQIPFDMENISAQEKTIMAICSIIRTEKLNNEDCYCMQTVKQGKTYLIKDTGVQIKTIGDGTMTEAGQTYERIVEIRDWTTDKVKDEDVAKPNLEGYEMREN